MLVVFLGPPGAGKGTQAARLIQLLKIPSLSTGEMLRAAKESGSELGESIREKLDTGHLVDDATVLSLVKESLEQPACRKGAMLDGFPRTVSQAQSLDEYLVQVGKKLDLVIQLVVPEKEILLRLRERYMKLDHPRPEDHPNCVPRRLEIYEEVTRPLAEYYAQQGILSTIDGMGTENEVFRRIQDSVDTVKSRY